MKKILITGRPGVGKTTLIKEILKAVDIDIRGFYTEELREHNSRVGFRIVELGTDHPRMACFAHKDFERRFKVGKYGVNVAILDEIGVKNIEKALIEQKSIIIDEIGRMELCSERFREAVKRSLDSSLPLVATITLSSLEFVEGIKKRGDVIVKELTRENSEDILRELISYLSEEKLP